LISTRALSTVPTLLRRPGVLLGRRQYVLLLSHMRSYSSVLSHVLGSQDEIAGYAEMHQGYEGRVGLLRLRARVARSLDGRLDGRFVLDKVLHDHHPVAAAVLERDDVRPIFLVRRPRETMASVLAMGERVPDFPWFSDVRAVTRYYAGRMRTLAGLARTLRSRALFVPAERVVDDTDATLGAIASFLGLPHGIDPSYRTFKHTGEALWGDSSERIRSGRIDARGGDGARAELPADLVAEASAAYDECLRAAAENDAVTLAEARA
jgi:hypothetical protein